MKRIKNILAPLLSLILCLIIVISPNVNQANASEIVINFDQTNILDDLNGLKINDVDFNIDNYPHIENADFELLNFVEYCYSSKPNNQNNYALYLYIYNPSKKEINVNSLSNKVQIATKYSSEQKPTDWSKYDLKFCSSLDGEYKNLFYKFKIKNVSNILSRVNNNPSSRRYDIGGIELVVKNSLNADEFNVGYTYVFTGFAQGLENNNTSTLAVTATKFKTVETQINSVNFRPNVVSSEGKYHQNNLTSVYFAVDTKLIEEYGNIQRIKAVWEEYRTNFIFLTYLGNLYNNLLPYVGIDIGNGIINNDTYGLAFDNWVYNTYTKVNLNVLKKIVYLDGKSVDNIKDLQYSSQELLRYILRYNKSFDNGYINIGNELVSADLFMDTVDIGRTRGRNEKIFDIKNSNDWLDMKAYSSTHNGWEKFWDFFFDEYDLTTEYPNIKPIVELKAEDFNGTDEQISKRLYIDVKDLYRADGTSMKDYNKQMNDEGKTLVLLRIANTDYYSATLDMLGKFLFLDFGFATDVGYVSYQTVFLNFDVIWLDFVNGIKSTIIPVVASPINIIADITPPLEGESLLDRIIEFLKRIITIIFILLFLIILIQILPYIIAFLKLVIGFPIKIIKAIIRPKPRK